MPTTELLQKSSTWEARNADLHRALLQTRIAHIFLTEMICNDPQMPEAVTKIANHVAKGMNSLEYKIFNHTDGRFPWLREEVSKEKLWDISSIIDLMTRIGTEENPGFYEEFLGLLTSCLNSVYYMQNNRKKIHFGKYKALFKLIIDEIKADTDQQQGQVYFKNNTLYLRTAQPEQDHQVK